MHEVLAFFPNVKNYYENIPCCFKSVTIPKWMNPVQVPPTGSLAGAWAMPGASFGTRLFLRGCLSDVTTRPPGRTWQEGGVVCKRGEATLRSPERPSANGPRSRA